MRAVIVGVSTPCPEVPSANADATSSRSPATAPSSTGTSGFTLSGTARSVATEKPCIATAAPSEGEYDERAAIVRTASR